MSKVLSGKFRNYNFNVWCCFGLLALISAGCQSAEEKRPGEYIIESFVFQGADSLAYLQRYNMDGHFLLRDYQDPTFSLYKRPEIGQATIGDSIIIYEGDYRYLNKDREIEFTFNSLIITVFNGRTSDWVYFDDPHVGTYQPPLLIEGVWNIKKEGQETMILELKEDKNTRLNLRRVNNQ